MLKNRILIMDVVKEQLWEMHQAYLLKKKTKRTKILIIDVKEQNPYNGC
jgi:hypothetical protein